MASQIIREWKVTVALSRELKVSAEDLEDESEVREWLRSPDGRSYVRDEFKTHMLLTGYSRNTDMEILEVALEETEVNSTDKDPRV